MVEMVLGKREQISYIEEATYGSPLTPTDVLARNARFEPRDSQNWQEIRGAAEDTIDVHEREKGPLTFGGILTFAPQNWKWLKLVVCDGSSDIVDNDEGTYYSHTFTNAVDIGSFTMERARQLTGNNDNVSTYEGCQVDRCAISWDSAGGEGNALMSVVLDIIAENKVTGTSVTSLVAPVTAAFQFRNVILTLNGSEVTELVGGTFNIENNIHDARYSNYTLDRYKGESAPTVRRFNGTFRIKLEGSAANTYNALWEAAAVVGSTNTLVFRRGTNDEITCTFTDLRLHESPDPTNLEGVNEITINWSAKSVAFVANDQVTVY